MGPTRMRLSKPVIAAISGHAVAGGLELALWCDLRVAEEDAVLGVFCRRWGVPLIDGGTVRLPRIVGLGRALDLILTGGPSRPPRRWPWAWSAGVVPAGQARAAAEALARELAALPQACLRSDRLSRSRACPWPRTRRWPTSSATACPRWPPPGWRRISPGSCPGGRPGRRGLRTAFATARPTAGTPTHRLAHSSRETVQLRKVIPADHRGTRGSHSTFGGTA